MSKQRKWINIVGLFIILSTCTMLYIKNYSVKPNEGNNSMEQIDLLENTTVSTQVSDTITSELIVFDEAYYFYGMRPQDEVEKYDVTPFLAPSGLCIFFKNNKVVAFSNFLPGAN